MKSLLFIFFVLLNTFCYAQNQINFDNNITANYYQKDNSNNISINYTGENSLKIDSLSIDLNTNYNYLNNERNELSQRLTTSYKSGIHHSFITYQFNYSYLRQIKSDNWVGVGYGIKKKVDSLYYNISYATIYQNVDYYNSNNFYQFRHSLRVKVRWDGKNVALASEIFYQPSYFTINNYIIYGTSKIIFLPKNKFNFIIQDVINYNSYDNIKLIHTISFGLQYKLSKKY